MMIASSRASAALVDEGKDGTAEDSRKLESKLPRAKGHLPGLNALRFLAASCVVLNHIEQAKRDVGLPNIFGSKYMVNLGPQAVSLFFVLSGYLITYLLLKELRRWGSIDVSAFYLRRMFRIWPLYYCVILCGFFLVPFLGSAGGPLGLLRQSNAVVHANLPRGLLYCLFLFPNVTLWKFGPIFMITSCWSLGVEEQFYLIWPWFVRATGKFFVPILTVALMLKLTLHRAWVAGLYDRWPMNLVTKLTLFILGYLTLLPIEYMAFGALAGILFYHRPEWVRRYLQNPVSGSLALVLLGLGLAGTLGQWDGLAYAFILLSGTHTRLAFIPIENRVLNYLGDLSYGIYLLHPLSVLAALGIFALLRPVFGPHSVAIVYPLTFSLTLIAAALSFRFLEFPFLRWKQRWTRS